MIAKMTEAVIYESPDGGKTVYIRKPGDVHRELHWESPEAIELRETMIRNELWANILAASKNNPTLKGILDQAELIYKLSK